MPALGKTNASRVQSGDRILVQVTETGVTVAQTKTGAGVTVARVIGKDAGAPGRARMTYTIRTTAGDLRNLAPIQTMWLAPEDAAGVKRARLEALAECGQRQAAVMTDLEEGLMAQALEDMAPVGPTQEDLEELADMAPVETAWDALDRAVQPLVAQALEPKVPTAAGKSRDLQLAAYAGPFTQVGPGVYVAPIGTPEPTPEDLSDLASTLAEYLDPEEEVPPADPKCQPRDVVTIHRGTRLYEVLRVEVDGGWDRIRQERVDHSMALVVPLAMGDARDPQWVHLDLLHVRRPVARLETQPGITPRIRETREALALEGRTMVVRTILVDSARAAVAGLREAPRLAVGPVATLRVGEALVVDGRCYAVTEEGELEPAPHRDRLYQPGPQDPEVRAEAIRDWEESNRPS